jgi:hypothetical protein
MMIFFVVLIATPSARKPLKSLAPARLNVRVLRVLFKAKAQDTSP